MINLSLNELKLIAQYRNISGYESKSKEDLIKALSKPKPKLAINKTKSEEIRKDFYKLRQTFSKKEADKCRKVFYDIKNYRNRSELKIEEIRKNRVEQKIQLTMQNSCISTRSFEETRTIYKKNEPVEILMGSNTEDVIDELFNTLLQSFKRAQETLNER